MRPDSRKHQSNGRYGEQPDVRRPFDSREIEDLPQATDDDPPYRPWWIVDGPASGGPDPQT